MVRTFLYCSADVLHQQEDQGNASGSERRALPIQLRTNRKVTNPSVGVESKQLDPNTPSTELKAPENARIHHQTTAIGGLASASYLGTGIHLDVLFH